jgi:hypothetical protein
MTTATEGREIYRLVTIDETYSLTLTTAHSCDKRTAFRELKQWADANEWVVRTGPEHHDADCQIQVLTPIN